MSEVPQNELIHIDMLLLKYINTGNSDFMYKSMVHAQKHKLTYMVHLLQFLYVNNTPHPHNTLIVNFK